MILPTRLGTKDAIAFPSYLCQCYCNMFHLAGLWESALRCYGGFHRNIHVHCEKNAVPQKYQNGILKFSQAVPWMHYSTHDVFPSLKAHCAGRRAKPGLQNGTLPALVYLGLLANEHSENES